MSVNQNNESIESPEFNLKHRITGAAILLFFGAAVLPWLLGPPSQANKVMPDIMVADAAEVPSDIEEAVLSIDGNNAIEVEESIYISKITPLDASKKTELRKIMKNEAVVKDIEAKQVHKESPKPEGANTSKKETLPQEEIAKKSRLKEQKEKLTSDEREKAQQETVDALKAKLAKEQSNSVNKVDVGWIVQVGLFTEKNRAIAFVSELKTKGFTASSNVVDTNRGKNTGTRVWLGPFARKASAANEVKRLKAKAGKDGFIRVYP